MKLKLSANLGFLWNDRPLPEAVRAAADAGFDAVECHWPYALPAPAIKQALQSSGLTMVSLNTAPGDLRQGEFGLNAVSGRETQARQLIDQAIEYAVLTDTPHIHLMAGIAEQNEVSKATFLSNIDYASRHSAAHDITILIEPINTRDVPGYYLTHIEQARELIAASSASNLKILFDCYHLQIMQGELLRRFAQHLDLIGHVQFAAVPSRAEPDEGELRYEQLLPDFVKLGYQGFFGAEYRPRGLTQAGLGWMKRLQGTSAGVE